MSVPLYPFSTLSTDQKARATEKPSKALICFHGTGAKGSIFNVQMAHICFHLRNDFEFIFVDGPIEGPAGPGVLPLFSGDEPYYCWFDGNSTSIEDSIGKITVSIKQQVEHWTATRKHPATEIVGAIGFSEGALALLLMLWQQQQHPEMEPLIPKLRFAALSCCFFPNEVSLWLNSKAQEAGASKAYIDLPTLHIHGNRDFCLGRSRKLVRNHYRSEFATVVQAEAGHHMPVNKEDVAKIATHLLRLAQLSAACIPR